jgi:hypothetical protein
MATHARRRRGRATPTQARAARRQRRERRRRLLRFGAFGTVGALAIIFIVALFLPSIPISIGGGGPTGDAGERMPDQGTRHIDEGQEHPPYNSVPATSGWHYPSPLAPVPPGVYGTSIPDEQLLHNLEHGGVGVHYNCPDGCDELKELLSSIVRGVNEIVMSPFPRLDTRIALTAWTYIDKFDEFDEDRVRTFIGDHLNSPVAPEYTARGGNQMIQVDDGG